MNHKEFGAVAERLCAKFGQPKPDFWACLSIRENVKNDAIQNRRLQCHCTVYDAKMNAHPEASRQCAGLAAYLKSNALLQASGDDEQLKPKRNPALPASGG